MKRIDHIGNPDAPSPNSVVPSAVAFVLNDQDELLLIERTDNHDWALPGGGHSPGERIADTAVRETYEETGLDIEIDGLIGIYTDPEHLIEYTSDGEVRQQFSLSFRAHPIGGSLATSTESHQVRWIAKTELSHLPMNSGMRLRVKHGYMNLPTVYIGLCRHASLRRACVQTFFT